MTSRSRLAAIDICNTICGINPVLEKLLGRKPDPSVYDHPGLAPDFFTSNAAEVFGAALPLPGAVEGVKALARRYRIVYLTARPEEARQVTLEWMRYWGFPEGELVMTQDKARAARELGVDLAIDDAPHELQSLRRVVPVVLAKRQPYNTGLAPAFEWTAV
ncbi:hypothetical protein V3F56_03590 [Moorellaceae bacterium AZ2]